MVVMRNRSTHEKCTDIECVFKSDGLVRKIQWKKIGYKVVYWNSWRNHKNCIKTTVEVTRNNMSKEFHMTKFFILIL